MGGGLNPEAAKVGRKFYAVSRAYGRAEINY